MSLVENALHDFHATLGVQVLNRNCIWKDLDETEERGVSWGAENSIKR